MEKIYSPCFNCSNEKSKIKCSQNCLELEEYRLLMDKKIGEDYTLRFAKNSTNISRGRKIGRFQPAL